MFLTFTMIELQEDKSAIMRPISINSKLIESVIEVDDEKTLICTSNRQILVAESFLIVNGTVIGVESN